MCGGLSTQTLQFWLEWAGARLVAMPGRREGPAATKVIWPEYDQEKFEVLTFRGRLPLRAAAPDKDEIPLVDEILLFPNLCSQVHVRRVLHARALVHPLNQRHLFPWSRIAKLLHSDHKQVQRWHRKGLEEVVSKVDRSKVCRIEAFLGT